MINLNSAIMKETEQLINKAANWFREKLANTNNIPMCDWNKEFWVTAFIGYMNKEENKTLNFTKYQIKAVKGANTVGRKYWFNAEILLNGKWVHPYFVQEEQLNWYEPHEEMYFDEKNIKKWLGNVLNYINEILSKGYPG